MMQDEFDFMPKPDHRPVLRERLFFAWMVDAELAAEVDAFRTEFMWQNGLQGSLIRPARFHLSLQKIGDFKRLRSQQIEAARRVASRVAMRSFDMTFGMVGSFDGPPPPRGRMPRRPTSLLGECEAVNALHACLGEGMREFGMRPSDRITPHITLLYGHDLVPCTPIKAFRAFVRSFALIHSERGLTRYNILGEWTLH